MSDGIRTALVTGAAAGLGAAYAKRLAQDGCRVALADINSCEATATAITQAGGEARSYVCNIADEASIATMVGRIAAEMGGVDILVNNAGVYDFTPHETINLAVWRKIMSLNLDGMFMLTQAVIPGMKAKGWGRIINIASNSCFTPPPGLTAYVASKSASIGYVKSLAGELGQYGITVNAVAPGPTATEGTRGGFPDEASFQGFMNTFLEGQSIKKISIPEFSAPVVSFFASDEADFVTGQTLVVDGGSAKH